MCRAWFFKTINVLIVSVCVGIVFTSVSYFCLLIITLAFIPVLLWQYRGHSKPAVLPVLYAISGSRIFIW
jgi:hypothetical protein